MAVTTKNNRARGRREEEEEPEPFKRYYCCGVLMARLSNSKVYECKGSCGKAKHEQDLN